MGELDTGLLGANHSEDVVGGALQHALQHGQVGNNAAGVEVLEAIEDDVITLRRDLQVVVARIDGTTEEQVVADNILLQSLSLLSRADDIGRGRPEQVVAQQHTEGAMAICVSDIALQHDSSPTKQH